MQRNLMLRIFPRYAIALLFLSIAMALPVLPESRNTTKPAVTVSGMKFVAVKGGCFQMGCGKWFWNSNCENDEKPVRRICLDTFLIGQHEITQRQWQMVMGDNPAYAEDCGPDCPIEMVSWQDAHRFITRLNELHRGKYQFRLPTEAEWEYACRSGGQPEIFCGGNNNRLLAWYRITSANRPHPVGTKQPNGLGIYDMSGNVWEWCEDPYGIYTTTTTTHPETASKSTPRVIRGGGWGDYYSRFCRSAYRGRYLPHLKSKFIGLRLIVKKNIAQ